MKPVIAEFELEDGHRAVYVDLGADVPRLPDWPMLAIGVADYDAAVELLDLISKNRTRASAKRKSKKPSSSAPAAGPATPAGAGGGVRAGEKPRCIAPGCNFDADFGTDCCALHDKAAEEQKAEWRKALKVTPPAAAAKKAREIREQLEDGSITGGLPGQVG